MNKSLVKFGGLVLWIIISFLPSLTAVFVRPDAWYATIIKSPLNPPPWIFAPVWTTLYLLMGISAWLIWISGDIKKTWALLTLFLFHLVLNGLWSYLFFGLQSPSYALVDIILLFTTILLMIILFIPVHRVAAILLFPYLIWVGFASYLNFYIWLKN